MGIKMKDILPEGAVLILRDIMSYDNHDFILSPIKYNTCFLYDWTKGIREALCDIRLEDGCTCILTGMKSNPGITFRKESGEDIGFAPFNDDLTGIRDDIRYSFLDVESTGEIFGASSTGVMQSLRLRLNCD